MIKTEKLTKLFATEEVQTKALNEVTLQVEQGEFVAIMGAFFCTTPLDLTLLPVIAVDKTLCHIYETMHGKTSTPNPQSDN